MLQLLGGRASGLVHRELPLLYLSQLHLDQLVDALRKIDLALPGVLRVQLQDRPQLHLRLGPRAAVDLVCLSSPATRFGLLRN